MADEAFSFYPWAVAKDELSSGDNPGCLSEEIAERSSTDRPELERRSTMAKALGLGRKPTAQARLEVSQVEKIRLRADPGAGADPAAALWQGIAELTSK